ncbi:MAG: hypothetical protein IBJ03_17785 [Gemmatimonadaceae bacterium]|nr:hypothetical protein [Gemmatimonadaceae bacterium]
MSRFFPRDVIHWGEETLHPLRAFAIRSIEPAGITGLVLRLWRAVLLASGSWVFFVVGLTAGILFLCGMLTWHLGNFPVRRWPMRLVAFWIIEVIVEMGTSTLLIALGRERFGSTIATWDDWWSMAAQTTWQRGLLMALFTLVLAVVVQLVRRVIDQRAHDASHATSQSAAH